MRPPHLRSHPQAGLHTFSGGYKSGGYYGSGSWKWDSSELDR